MQEIIEKNIKILALIRNKHSTEAKELLKMDVEVLETGNLFKKIFSKDLSNIKCLINLLCISSYK